MKTLQEVRNFFSGDIYATETTGIEIVETQPGYAKVSLNVDGRHLNAMGQVMGGVYFTMADFCASVAINHDFDGPLTVAMVGQISFLSSARGKTLYAEGRVVKDGKKVTLCAVDVTDDKGTHIAQVSVNGYRTSRTGA